MIIRIFLTILLPLMGFTFVGHCQTDALTPVKEYYNHLFYDVETVHKVLSEGNKPQNIILMIGDGMGVAQIQAGMIANKGSLYLNQFPCIGFAMTHSADSFITDSGAGGTAIASGVKTFRSAIGVGFDSLPVPNLSEQMKKTGKSVGVVVTSSVTHATPAAFVSHQLNRDWDEAIAMDFSVADIDLFIGGGYSYFSHRSDTVSLIQQLEDKGFQVVRDMEEMAMVQNGKLAALLADEHLPYRLDGRGDMLPVATQKAVSLLEDNPRGFFLMVEGSQIDWGGHDNHLPYIITEMLDFDQAVGEVLKYAAQDQNTLVIVTADHETGGLALHDGDYETGYVKAEFTSLDHTGVMVPVFAFGPGADTFTGFYQNTDIFAKIMALLQQ